MEQEQPSVCSLPAHQCWMWMVSQTIPQLKGQPPNPHFGGISTFWGDIHHIVKGYSSAAQLSRVISALKAKIIWRDFVHLLSCLKCVKNTCLQSGDGRGACEHSHGVQ